MERDFNIYRRDRTDRTGGGVLLAVRENILSMRRRDLEKKAEILVCEIHPESRKKMAVIVFYRPPDSDLNYIKEFKKTLQLIRSQNKFDQLIVCGDFNLPNIDWNTGVTTNNNIINQHFTKTVKDHYLWQLVNFPTRGENTLDLILTNIPDKIQNVAGFDDVLETDHKLIHFEINLKLQRKPRVERLVYDFAKPDWSSLKVLLSNSRWDLCFVSGNIDETLSNWCCMFLSAVDKYIPKHCIKRTHNHPWIDKELLKLIKRKDIQRRKLKKFPSKINLEKYKNLRRLTKQLIKQKKKQYNINLTESLYENPRRFWSAVKHSTENRKDVNFLKTENSYTTDNVEIANILNTFFHSVFNPKDSESFTTPPLPLTSTTAELSSIQLTEIEVVGVLRNLNSRKACGPDNIPNRLLIELADVIAPSLCDVFNMSLALGVVPLQWKMANITPVHKREDPMLATNYRPISLLCTLSKVLERCVHNHSYQHLEPHMYHMQHGFIRGKSTTTQLLEVYHKILQSIASGNEVDAIYLDFSKAFDKVPHRLLLTKLETLGITGSLLSWFESYLTDRQQRVVINGVCLEWLPVTSGVPQGSILGPLLFLVYCNDIPMCIEENSTLALFADDSKLYRTLSSPTSSASLQHDLCNITRWTTNNQMELNVVKCKAMHISRKRTSTQTQYVINENIVEQVPIIKDLGVLITNNLCWSKHIESIVSSANKTLGLVKRICKEVKNTNTRKTLYCALVRPKLEYASSVWSPYTIKHRLLIENVQRRASKFILNYPENMSYIERLQKAKLLPLEFRREISDLILLFKSKHRLITMDINKYIYTYNPSYQSRNYDENNFNIIIRHKQDYFQNSYFVRTVKLWNNLPTELKATNSLGAFKTRLNKLYSWKTKSYKLPNNHS